MPAGSEPPIGARRPGPESGQADEALDDALRAARAGDDAGFLTLWRTFHPRLLRYLTVSNGQAAEDIAAETWLQVVRDLRSFIGDADGFRAWLFTVARHRAIDAARARRARPVVPVDDVNRLHPSGIRTEPSAETEALERVSTEQALALVASLPPAQAEMVLLRVVAGLDVPAVARIVGKSPGAVRVTVHRGLRALSRQPRAASVEAV